MVLTINLKEIEAILLQHAEAAFPGKFNTVVIDANYSSVSKATFSMEEKASVDTQVSA